VLSLAEYFDAFQNLNQLIEFRTALIEQVEFLGYDCVSPE